MARVTNEEYRGAHRRHDDDDALYDDAQIDDAAYADAEYADDAAATGGSTAVAAGGVPKRGLAMILIAVAALLLLWGIYAMTQNGNTGREVATSTSESATATAATAATATVATDTATPGAAAPAEGQQADGADAPAPAPAPAGGEELTAANAQVFVFNNSAVPNAATDTANQLDAQYAIANASPDAATMNMPEQQYGVFPETTVFFDPQVAGAEQVAADIAARVGGTPRAYNDLPAGAAGLPAEATGNRNAITVVIAG